MSGEGANPRNEDLGHEFVGVITGGLSEFTDEGESHWHDIAYELTDRLLAALAEAGVLVGEGQVAVDRAALPLPSALEATAAVITKYEALPPAVRGHLRSEYGIIFGHAAIQLREYAAALRSFRESSGG